VLVDLAENELGLHRISVPPRFKGSILQVMTATPEPEKGPRIS
jgi:hypothetical protein